MRVGIDLGGTKIEAIALDEDGDAASDNPRASRRLCGDAIGVEALASLVWYPTERLQVDQTGLWCEPIGSPSKHLAGQFRVER